MIDMDNNEHANNTNPCQGICVTDGNGTCIGCQRTDEERNKWYIESVEWRENILAQLSAREEKMFGDK